MLPNIHRQCYQKFSEVLQQLQQTGDRTPIDPLTLHNSFLEAQQFFQQQIVSLDAGDLEAGDESRVRSYQTEISKQLRLLGMDVKFLQAARQQETVKARQMQLLERLKMLQGYCDRILQLN
ncbi:MAG: heterocyst frequency control protein PatD [Gloeocapsa sp. UFS-A4-WI-NPMV-4B04]|jgi:hypothetical protein|nr:heterocyst frequency control protein PatD [Gloeocapsa sp. UFS-A4-WI-NPMV-4B04]